ncbi:MAG: hypothetical protein HKL90_12850 [Elusimicrobia bacterium]|nr:hypothetical protein [Elusimicrobiota bacterium]
MTPRQAAADRRAAAAALIALGAWLLLLRAAAPVGSDVPIGDDWAYASSVRGLLETGRLRMSQFAGPAAVVHVLWGALFCLPAGFSLSALRLSTLAAAALALVAFERLLAELGYSPAQRLLGAALLAFNPLFFVLSLSFYTDILFLALFLLSALAVLKGLSGSRGWLWAAAACSVLSVLTRQIGVAPALAGALMLVVARRQRDAAIVVIPPLAALVLHAFWFVHVHGVTHGAWYHAHESLRRLRDPLRLAVDCAARSAAAAAYLGWLIFPLGVCAALSLRAGPRPSRARLLLAAAAAGLWLAAHAAHVAPPTLGDQIGRLGLGVVAVPGAAFKAAGWWSARPLWLTGGALSLATLAAFAAGGGGAPTGAIFFIGASLLTFAPALLSFSFFDRYLLTLVPCAIAAGLGAARARPKTAWAGAALLGLLSAAGAFDSLSWNAALWKAGAAAQELGYPADEIRGGLSWDGAHIAERNLALLRATRPLESIKPYDWLALQKPRALLSFDPSPPPGTRRLMAVAYATPLTSRGGAVYVYGLAPKGRAP